MNYRIDELRDVLREDPSSRQFYQLGEMLRREGGLEEAVAVFRAGLEHHPRYVAAWVSLGRALTALGRHDDAMAAFSRALEIDPENAVAARNLGRSALARGELERAVEALALAVELIPGDETIREELAEARRRLGGRRPFSRPEVILTVAEAEPFAAQPGGGAGALEAVDDVFGAGPEAAGGPAPEAAEAVTAEEPEELPLPTATLARLALEQGDLDLARKTARAVLERDPESAGAWAVLGEVAARETSRAPSGAEDPRAARIAALQRWLGAVKLALEKRAP